MCKKIKCLAFVFKRHKLYICLQQPGAGFELWITSQYTFNMLSIDKFIEMNYEL